MLGTQTLLIQKWTEYVQQYTNELFEAIGDSNPEQYAGFNTDTIAELTQAVQMGAFQKTYELLKKQQNQIVETLQNKIAVSKETLIDPPVKINDKDSQVETLCLSAIQQRSKNNKVAIQLLRDAQSKSSTNWRISEWLGTLYMQSSPYPNYLKARESFELIPSGWISFARDWNLTILYYQSGDQTDKVKAFELLKGSFMQDPRIRNYIFAWN